MVSLKKSLAQHTAFPWFETETTSCRGYVYDQGNWIADTVLLNRLSDISTLSELTQFLSHAHGHFSAILTLREGVTLVSDRLRSFPLFYTLTPDTVHVMDTVSHFSKTELDPLAFTAFRACGFTLGTSTVFKGIQACTAGGFVCISSADSVKQITYDAHRLCVEKGYSHADYTQRLDALMESFRERFIASLQGRPVALPLSGGYDSRVLACLLKQAQYPHVLCYTYGQDTSFERERAEKTARQLGFDWVFIPYSKQTWEALFSDRGKHYLRLSHNGVSMPHIQDFMAVSYLHAHQRISKDTLFVPGFSGDVLGGSHIPSAFLEDKTYLHHQVIETVWKQHMTLFLPHQKQAYTALHMAFSQFFPTETRFSQQQAVSAAQTFDYTHRMSKFIVNAVRCFEFFGYEWRLPLWDHPFTQFWHHLPIEFRAHKVFYDRYFEQTLFEPFGVSFPAYVPVTQTRPLQLLKRVLPLGVYDGIKSLAKSIMRDSVDYNRMQDFIDVVRQQTGHPLPLSHRNDYCAMVDWVTRDLYQVNPKTF